MLPSFLPVDPDSHFPLNNLPLGVFSTAADPSRRLGTRVGDAVVDVRALAAAGLLAGSPHLTAGAPLAAPSLNALLAAGRPAWDAARAGLTRLLSAGEGALRDDAALRAAAILPAADATMHLPAHIGDYTDFFACREHAANCGAIFRGAAGGDALPPAWLSLPVAYHGRASTVVPSGTPVRRPWGQVRRAPGGAPAFEPSAELDFELEVGALLGGPANGVGTPVPVSQAGDRIFGLVLLNDWSARDVQRWESAPLGPFCGKNFATSVSPWVVPLAALAPWAEPAPPQAPPPLPYLQEERRRHYPGVAVTATLAPAEGGPPAVVSRASLGALHWSLPQMVAHHAAGGCALAPGDLLGTGTLSAPGPGGQGCLLEQSRGGAVDVDLGGGRARRYLADGDEVVLSGWAQGDGFRVGFGECAGRVLPALPAAAGG